jgi:hypothetical protein
MELRECVIAQGVHAPLLRWPRKRMPKVMVGTPNRGLFFAGNAGRTFSN